MSSPPTPESIALSLGASLCSVKYPADIILMVDGSGSVGDREFDILKLCLHQLVVRKYSTSEEGIIKLGLIQFDQNIKIECGLIDTRYAKHSISRMTRMGGGTNIKGALEAAGRMFDACERAAQRCVVMFTDGEDGNATHVAKEMHKNTHIVVIAIGQRIDHTKIASKDSYFLVSSFDDLLEVFANLDFVSAGRPEIRLVARSVHNATVRINLPPEVLKFKKWQLDVFNLATAKWEIVSESEADILAIYNLSANTRFKLRGRVLMSNNIWSDYSEDLGFRTLIEHPQAQIICDKVKREAECKRLIDVIKAAKPNGRLRKAGVTQYNILLLGRMSAGKSSLLNTVASALFGKYTILAPFRTSMETVTTQFKMHSVIRNEKREPQIVVGDVYGWDESNYKNEELAYILDGHVKSETNSGFEAVRTNLYYHHEVTFNDKIHAVIVVISSLTVGSTCEMRRLCDFYKAVVDKGLQPIFVVTRLDRLPDEILIGKPENVLYSGIVEATIQNLCDLAHLPRPSAAFEKALENARIFLEVHEETIVEEAAHRRRKKRGTSQGESEEEKSSEPVSDSDSSDSTKSMLEKEMKERFASFVSGLVETGQKAATRGDWVLSNAYNLVASIEGNLVLSENAKVQLQQSLKLGDEVNHEAVVKEISQQRAVLLKEQQAIIQQKIDQLSQENDVAAQELQQKRDEVREEQLQLEQRLADFSKREEELFQRQQQQAKEFEEMRKKWQEQIAASLPLAASETEGDNEAQETLDAEALITEVSKAREEVAKDKLACQEMTTQAEAAQSKLADSEKSLQEKIDCLQNYISFVEQQGILPQVVHFNELLKAVKRLREGQKKMKCFISYAWNPDKDDNAKLQAQLTKIKGDLTKAGVEVLLDIHNMEGDIDKYMLGGIQDCDRVLLICTPRLKERAEQKSNTLNNLQKEIQAARDRQRVDPKFIIPLLLHGSHSTAIMDPNFSKQDDYCEKMVSLAPKGLIPMLLNLENNKLYAHLVSAYFAKVKELEGLQKRHQHTPNNPVNQQQTAQQPVVQQTRSEFKPKYDRNCCRLVSK